MVNTRLTLKPGNIFFIVRFVPPSQNGIMRDKNG